MTKLNEKSLSQLLEEIEPSEFFQSNMWKNASKDLCVDGWPAAVVLINQESRKLYEQNQKLKQVAIELAKALVCNETFHSLGGIDDCEPCKAIRRAKDIIGEVT